MPESSAAHRVAEKFKTLLEERSGGHFRVDIFPDDTLGYVDVYKRQVIHTVVNALAIVSGIVCDGAKASCAGKIAAAVDAGILGYRMYQAGQQFYGGDGILSKGVEQTLENVGRLGKVGMSGTDREILKIMLGENAD